jgi:hypothetical protein
MQYYELYSPCYVFKTCYAVHEEQRGEEPCFERVKKLNIPVEP